MRSRMAVTITVFACALFCRAALADYVILTNGTVIEGDVVEDGDTVKVTVRGATMTFARSQIKTVGRGALPRHGGVTVEAAPRRERRQLSREEREELIKRNLAAQRRAREILGALTRDSRKEDREAARILLVELRPFPGVTVAEFLAPRSPVPARIVAARVIGQADDGDAASSLANAAVQDEDAGVRSAAATAIGRMTDLRPINALVDVAAKAKARPAVLRAAQAIRVAGRKEAVGGLISKAMRDVKKRTARGMAIGGAAPPSYPGGMATPGGAAQRAGGTPSFGMFRTTPTGLPAGVPVLQELTGQAFGPDLRAWAAWWEQNHKTFRL